MTVLGKRIKYLREKLDLSQKELAAKLGITNTQLNRYELGQRNPDPSMINHIASFFNTSADFLLGRTNNYGAVSDGLEKKLLLKDIDEGKTDEEIIKKYGLLEKIADINPDENEIKAMVALVRMMRDNK